MPKVSEAHRVERRRQIVDGARRAFAQLGYHGASVEELEREIGLSRGAIFSYYPTKLDLFVALAQADQERLLRRWIDDGYEGVVRHVAEEEPDWVAVYLDVSRMLRTDPALRERWKALNPELQTELEASFRKLVESGQVRSDVPFDTIGRFLGIVLDGIAVQLGAGFGAPIDV